MKNNARKLLICALLIFCLAQPTSVFAVSAPLKPEHKVTMEDINSRSSTIIEISPETNYYQSEGISSIKSFSLKAKSSYKYPITAVMTKEKSSSSGIQYCSQKTGTYASIASTALSFMKGIPSMTVSTIFSVVSLAVSQDQYAQAKTFKSYVEYKKNGKAKWANSAYFTMVISGRREYYKHVVAAKKNKNGKWTTKSKDYVEKPAKVSNGMYYNKSAQWFKDQARDRLQNGMTLIDLPW